MRRWGSLLGGGGTGSFLGRHFDDIWNLNINGEEMSFVFSVFKSRVVFVSFVFSRLLDKVLFEWMIVLLKDDLYIYFLFEASKY
jgi:hypothetical protein